MRTGLWPKAKFSAKIGQNRRRSCKRGAKTTRWRLTEAHGSQHGNHVWCRHCAGNICKQHAFLTLQWHRNAPWIELLLLLALAVRTDGLGGDDAHTCFGQTQIPVSGKSTCELFLVVFHSHKFTFLPIYCCVLVYDYGLKLTYNQFMQSADIIQQIKYIFNWISDGMMQAFKIADFPHLD